MPITMRFASPRASQRILTQIGFHASKPISSVSGAPSSHTNAVTLTDLPEEVLASISSFVDWRMWLAGWNRTSRRFHLHEWRPLIPFRTIPAFEKLTGKGFHAPKLCAWLDLQKQVHRGRFHPEVTNWVDDLVPLVDAANASRVPTDGSTPMILWPLDADDLDELKSLVASWGVEDHAVEVIVPAFLRMASMQWTDTLGMCTLYKKGYVHIDSCLAHLGAPSSTIHALRKAYCTALGCEDFEQKATSPGYTSGNRWLSLQEFKGLDSEHVIALDHYAWDPDLAAIFCDRMDDDHERLEDEEDPFW